MNRTCPMCMPLLLSVNCKSGISKHGQSTATDKALPRTWALDAVVPLALFQTVLAALQLPDFANGARGKCLLIRAFAHLAASLAASRDQHQLRRPHSDHAQHTKGCKHPQLGDAAQACCRVAGAVALRASGCKVQADKGSFGCGAGSSTVQRRGCAGNASCQPLSKSPQCGSLLALK